MLLRNYMFVQDSMTALDYPYQNKRYSIWKFVYVIYKSLGIQATVRIVEDKNAK